MSEHAFGVTDEDIEMFGDDVDQCDALVKKIKEMIVEQADEWHAAGVDSNMKITRIMTTLTMLCGDMLFVTIRTMKEFGDESQGKDAGQLINEAAGRMMEGAVGIARLRMDLPVMSPRERQDADRFN